MKIDEFIESHKSWICYCEVIIDENGDVHEARPSHQEFLVKYMMNKEGMTRKEINEEIPIWCSPLHYIVDRYNLAAAWYNYVIRNEESYENDNINIAISKLMTSGLMSNKVDVITTNEYQLAIERREW